MYVACITVVTIYKNFANRVLKDTKVQMVLADMMVNQEKMVPMDQKEMMVILVMLVHVVYKDNVIIPLGLLDLKVKQDTKDKRYTHN